MPDSVEMPAPVSTTTWRALPSRLAIASISAVQCASVQGSSMRGGA